MMNYSFVRNNACKDIYLKILKSAINAEVDLRQMRLAAMV